MSLVAACLRRSAAMQAPALRSATRAAIPALGQLRSMSSVPTVTTSSGNVVPVDKYFDDESLVAHQARVRHADPGNRTFNYTVVGGSRFLGASAGRLLVIKFLSAMNPAADVLALASLEVDISNLSAGNCMVVKWRGKPVFVRARTEEEIEQATSVAMGDLRDPQTDEDRVKDPNYLVCLGVCTHLGCVPINGAGDFGGWFCPCHGSHYDTSGRIRKGPAPLNLEIPPYDFPEDGKLVVG